MALAAVAQPEELPLVADHAYGVQHVREVAGDYDGREHLPGELAALYLVGHVALQLDAPALGVLHAVRRAGQEEARIYARQHVFVPVLSGAEEGIGHARVCLALIGLAPAVRRPLHTELRGREEVRYAGDEDAVLYDLRP